MSRNWVEDRDGNIVTLADVCDSMGEIHMGGEIEGPSWADQIPADPWATAETPNEVPF